MGHLGWGHGDSWTGRSLYLLRFLPGVEEVWVVGDLVSLHGFAFCVNRLQVLVSFLCLCLSL